MYQQPSWHSLWLEGESHWYWCTECFNQGSQGHLCFLGKMLNLLALLWRFLKLLLMVYSSVVRVSIFFQFAVYTYLHLQVFKYEIAGKITTTLVWKPLKFFRLNVYSYLNLFNQQLLGYLSYFQFCYIYPCLSFYGQGTSTRTFFPSFSIASFFICKKRESSHHNFTW